MLIPMTLYTFGHDALSCPAHDTYRQIGNFIPHGVHATYERVGNDYNDILRYIQHVNGLAVARAFKRCFKQHMSYNSLRCLRCGDNVFYRRNITMPGNNEPEYLADESSYITYLNAIKNIEEVIAQIQPNADRAVIIRAGNLAAGIIPYLGGVRLIIEELGNDVQQVHVINKLLELITTFGIDAYTRPEGQ